MLLKLVFVAVDENENENRNEMQAQNRNENANPDRWPVAEPYRELFVWSVLFGRVSLANIFWKECPDRIGSALVASLMLQGLASKAKCLGKQHLAEELYENAGLVARYGLGFNHRSLKVFISN